MAKPLTVKKKKQIIATYSECQNYNETARMHKVAVDTVRRIIKADPDFAQKSMEKKTEIEFDLLSSMENQGKNIFALWMKTLSRFNTLIDNTKDPQRLLTAAGIMIDKTTKRMEYMQRQQEIDAKTMAAKMYENTAPVIFSGEDELK